MGRIKKFVFDWKDAWGSYGEGYDSSLVILEDGFVKLSFWVDSKPYTINVGDKEDLLIQHVEESGLIKLNGYHFAKDYVLDGDRWDVNIRYDDVVICTSGHCTVPYEFEHFMEYLHREWHLPLCRIARHYYHKAISQETRYGKKTSKT